MPTISARLGLAKPITSDAFSTAVLATNLQKIDDSPGTFIAQTAANLPATWGAAHTGMRVYQVDASLSYRWNGSAFVRTDPRGFLANNRRTSNLVMNATYQTACSVTVTVPVGNRNIALAATWSEVTGGAARMALFRGATQLVSWKVTTDGASCSYVDLAPAAGATTYSFQCRNNSGAGTPVSTLVAGAALPASIDCSEI